MNPEKFVDHYSILGLKLSSSEKEIKSQYRKLASIMHPDKNNGSKKSEEEFKALANAHEILSNVDKRAFYNKSYEEFYQIKIENTFQNNNTQANQKRKNPLSDKNSGSIINYIIWGVFIILIIYWIIPNETSTGSFKADKALKEQKKNRPESGELDFNK